MEYCLISFLLHNVSKSYIYYYALCNCIDKRNYIFATLTGVVYSAVLHIV